MPALLIGTIDVTDPDAWQQYVAQVGATFVPHGGEVQWRGQRAAVLAGAAAAQRVVVVRFPDLAALQAWHDSPAYQALVPLRERAARVTLVAYET